MRMHSICFLSLAVQFSFVLLAAAADAPADAGTKAAAPQPTPKAADPYASLKFSSGRTRSLKDSANDEIDGAKNGGRGDGRTDDLDANLRMADKISKRRTSTQKSTRKLSKKGVKSGAGANDREAPIGNTATTELVVDKADLSQGVLPTPGTVRSSVSDVANPVSRAAFEASLVYQSYKPAGIMRLPGLEPYDLSSVAAGPMVAVEVRWFPLHIATSQPLVIGPLLSVGYGQMPVKLYTPAGSAITRTELHLLKAETGASLGWQPSAASHFGARLELGIGQFTETQASTSSYANHSSSLLFSSAGLYAEFKPLQHLTLFAGYSYRNPINTEPEEFILQRGNILAGITGGFD